MDSRRYEFTFRRGGFGGDEEDAHPGGAGKLTGFRKLWLILGVIGILYLIHIGLSGPGYLVTLLIEYGLLIPIVLISLTVHEYAHARLADFLGDPTPRVEGRVSLDPRRHLDFLGTLLLFTAGFGWAKPVPVNPGYFRVPDRAMFFVSAAGPISNLLLALFGGFLAKLGLTTLAPYFDSTLSKQIYFAFVQSFMFINLGLALFNLLPVHPLDGSHLLSFFLSPSQRFRLRQSAGTLTIVLFMMVAFGLISSFLSPAVRYLYRAILSLYGIAG